MAYKKSLLWEVRKDGFKPSYLFGSIHIGSLDLSVLKESLKAFILSCEQCAVEISIDVSALQDLSDYHLTQNNDEHIKYIKSAKWNKLKRLLREEFDFDVSSVEHFKPLIILNLIIQKIFVKDHEPILDEWIWEYANSINRTMFGLETVQNHYEALNQIKSKDQYLMFYKTMKNVSIFKIKFSQLFTYYKAQDIRYLYKQAKLSTGTAKHILLTNRNHNMVDELDRRILLGNCFAAVGAAHLYGKDGMLRLLKLKNYKIRPIRINIL